MSDQATQENLQVLLTKLMTDRFCSSQVSDYDACLQNFVPQNAHDNYIDQSLVRRGMRKCKPYLDVMQTCMQDDKKQNAIFRAAALAPTCRTERKALEKCQRVRGRDCEAEALETVYCGMVYLVQRRQQAGEHVHE